METPSPVRSLPKVAPGGLATDSLKARFASGAFWSLLGAVISRGLTLLGAIGSGHLLGSSGLGELGIVQSTTSMFVALAGMGLGITARKYIAESRAKDRDRAGRYINLFLKVTLASGFVLSAIYLVALPTLSSTLPPGPGLARSLQVGAGLIFFGALNGTGLGVLSGFEAFKATANVGIVRGALTTALMLAGAAAHGVLGGVAGFVLAESVSALWVGAVIRREARERGIPAGSPANAKEWIILWKFGLPALLGSVAVLPALWGANVILVRNGGGFDQMGLYVAALKWHQLILFVPSSLSGIILPMLSNCHGAGDEEEFRSLFRLSVAVNLAITLVPSAVVILFSRSFMCLYGSEYEAGWPVLVVLSVAALPTVLNDILGQAIVSTGSIWCRMALDLLLALTLFVGSWWLIPRGGAMGLAIAQGMAFSATSAVLIGLTWKRPQRLDDDDPKLG
ncbi:MAG TPA: oligosaccharide flippase family protein [Isosphaeraceae bacterium]|nr:oligosaccharide flippase family protein [Isosphaeraceae bacterium]